MELLDTGISIDLPQLILQHMVRVSQQDKKGQVLPHGIWMGVVLAHLQRLGDALAAKNVENEALRVAHQDAITMLHGA
ncbi:hypothetical protein H5410_057247 [Solanum commersonii]|uniref:Uncharacterized protein n=1 Tax=Solanum commersonii TaxID=4109 RepID=A0A9J5WMG8_SOLCO|nr:hypothetical protein H5410_057247 [Solanum commersonii]